MNNIDIVCDEIRKSQFCVVFTGAGISVESGIPPFRGEGGVYNDIDVNDLIITNYLTNPKKSWDTIKSRLLFKTGNSYEPNDAHKVIAKLEQSGIVKAVITQNIDNLHQEAGTETIFELHGNGKHFICTKCGHKDKVSDIKIDVDFPTCSKCNGLTKPDFTFFGENLPLDDYIGAQRYIDKCDLIILIGTSGEVYPAAQMPFDAKNNKVKVIEINIEASAYTYKIVDYFVRGKASDILKIIENKLINY